MKEGNKIRSNRIIRYEWYATIVQSINKNMETLGSGSLATWWSWNARDEERALRPRQSSARVTKVTQLHRRGQVVTRRANTRKPVYR